MAEAAGACWQSPVPPALLRKLASSEGYDVQSRTIAGCTKPRREGGPAIFAASSSRRFCVAIARTRAFPCIWSHTSSRAALWDGDMADSTIPRKG